MLTIVGVGLAVALAVTMFSLREGVRASTRDLVTSSGIDVFLYAEGTNPLLQGNPNAPPGELAQGRALAAGVASDPDVEVAAPMLHEPVYVLAGGGVSDANSRGFIPETTERFVLPPFVEGGKMTVRGDPLHASGFDPATASGEAIVNENLAGILGLRVGDEMRLSLSPSTPTNELVFTVTGITSPDFESPQDKTVYVHLGELQFVTGKHERDAVDFIGVKLRPGADAAAVSARLAASQPVEPYTNDDLVREVGTLTSTFEGFAQMIGIVTLGVALLFVTTVMMIVVNERTAEIGMLRAIGMGRPRLFFLILAEAAILIAAATIVGFVVGWFGAIGFDEFLRASNAERTPESFHYTRFSWGLLLQVTGLVAVMGLVAGLIPAWRATRVNLLQALRSV